MGNRKQELVEKYKAEYNNVKRHWSRTYDDVTDLEHKVSESQKRLKNANSALNEYRARLEELEVLVEALGGDVYED